MAREYPLHARGVRNMCSDSIHDKSNMHSFISSGQLSHVYTFVHVLLCDYCHACLHFCLSQSCRQLYAAHCTATYSWKGWPLDKEVCINLSDVGFCSVKNNTCVYTWRLSWLGVNYFTVQQQIIFTVPHWSIIINRHQT